MQYAFLLSLLQRTAAVSTMHGKERTHADCDLLQAGLTTEQGIRQT